LSTISAFPHVWHNWRDSVALDAASTSPNASRVTPCLMILPTALFFVRLSMPVQITLLRMTPISWT
jgi:hypothetical protein